MRRSIWEPPLYVLFTLMLAGCTTTSSSPPNPSPPVTPALQQRNEGYSLLYGLMSDESNVDKLLIIKHADQPIHDLVKEIAGLGKDAKQQMEQFKKDDGTIVLDDPHLPAVEQEARDQTSKSEARELLTSSGKPFELRLVFTQAQAMGYGADLAKALAGHEDNAARKEFLTSVSQRCGALRERLMGLLAVK